MRGLEPAASKSGHKEGHSAMEKKLFQIGPWSIILTIFWTISLALLRTGLKQASGHFGYPLDDTYIHMAMARHFVQHGWWGVSLYGFSSASSSPLWTLLIASSFKLAGIKDWMPALLSLLSASATSFLIYFKLKKIFRPVWSMIISIIIIGITPLPIIGLLGLEHGLHCFLTTWLIFLSADYLQDTPSRGAPFISLPLLATFLTATRYEGLFLIGTAALLFIIRGRLLEGIVIGVSGLLPVAIYGWISVSKGWYFLPNTILLKGNFTLFSERNWRLFAERLSTNLEKGPHLMILILLLSGLYIINKIKKSDYAMAASLAFLFILTATLHFLFAATGWFYRYEAYLLFTGMAIIAILARSFIKLSWKEKGFLICLAIIFSVAATFPTFAARAIRAYREYPMAIKNVYEQQYQMALFVRQFYERKIVAANDIGAINYYADVYTLDLAGLASKEILEAKRENIFNKEFLRTTIAKTQPDIIIIYKSWFHQLIPPDWNEIGRWRIKNNVACGSDEVSFFTPLTNQERPAINNLKAFSLFLPASVRQSGKYINK